MNMKRLLTLVAFFATLQASAQQVNPVPDYVFRNQMSVGRNAVTDTAAYFSIGPRYGATKGFMPPIVGDTATFSSGKRNGLLIFSVQKNKFLYWDSVRVQWSDMAGSSGTYITGSGITGYVPQFNGTTTIDTSALFTLGNRLGVGTSSFAYNSTSTANVELNGTAGGILGFKRNDSARGYLWHTGSDMELANTTAGTLSFNTNSATRGSVSSAGVWRLHNLAGTGDRVVQASSNGTLSATTSVTGLVDTLTISTRAWRQKGLDSLAALEVSGSGTTNYVPKFTASSTIGNSQIQDNGSNIGYNVTPKTWFGSRKAIEINGGGALTGVTNLFMELYGNSYLDGSINYKYLNNGSAGIYGIGNLASGGSSHTFYTAPNGTAGANATFTAALNIFSNARIGINTTTDAGYQLDINGTLRSVNGANFATTSGNVGVGLSSTSLWSTSYRAVELQQSGNALFSGGINNVGVVSNLFLNTSTGAWTYGSNGFGNYLSVGNGSGDFSFFTAPSGTVGNTASLTTAMRLTTSGELLINTTSDAGDYKLQVSGNIYATGGLTLTGTGSIFTRNTANTSGFDIGLLGGSIVADAYVYQRANAAMIFATNNTERGRINSAGEWIIDANGTDAGDYKLQVVGNARIGTGKLDIASNTTFGLGVARSGTSEVAGQIYNSNGILYTGVESSAGGQIFTGSSAYAAVIGSGANYPLQFATNNATRATINTAGELLIGSTTDAGAYALQVTGAMYTTSTITTASPTADPVRPWKLGSVQAGTVALDTGNYVEVEINGTYYRLAIVTPL